MTNVQIAELRARAGRYAAIWCRRHPSDTEDFVQEALLKALEVNTDVVPGTILWRRMCELHRRRVFRNHAPLNDLFNEPSIDNSEDLFERLDAEDKLKRIFAVVTGQDRETLLLAMQHDFSHAAAARTLGISQIAMSSRVNRALDRVRERLNQPTTRKPRSSTPNTQHPTPLPLEAAA